MFVDYDTRNYLQEQSIPEIIKNAFEIYRDYFRELFLSYSLLVFPAWLISFIGLIVGLASTPALDPGGNLLLVLVLLFILFNYLVSTVASIAIVNIVSDIFLKNSVGIVKAYKSMSFKSIGKLIGTTLLFYLVLGMFVVSISSVCVVGNCIQYPWLLISVLVTLPLGVIVISILFLLYPPIVVIEKRWGFNALRRSASVGRGYWFRSFIIMFTMFLLITVGGTGLAVVLRLLFGPLAQLLGYMFSFLLYPLGFIYVVVMYYDLKVRKEGYDAAALEADLRH